MLRYSSGQAVKGYELFERIGAGAFGAVYRAYQSTLGREVAVKIILPGFASQPDFIRRFEVEAQLVARLEHLHIVPLYDYWRDPSGAYLVMRWLRGGSLQDALSVSPYNLASTVRLVDHVSAALAAAHRKEIVHRDLKPANILLDDEGNAYLTDFGIARDLGQPTGSLADGEAILGSPGYLSPEQIRRELVSPQSDIYSLGIVVYEMLTGKHPFQGLTPVEQMYAHLDKPLPQLVNITPEVQDGVNAVILKATNKNPRHRYKDVLEMAAAFKQAADLDLEEKAQPIELMTQRELEILELIVHGYSNKQIALKLYVELTTVKWFITQIYRKLNVHSRIQAIQCANELQLLSPKKNNQNEAEKLGAIELQMSSPPNPYKGLRAFKAADQADFFGREALTEKLLKSLSKNRFLAVVGPSGCGKSSLVNAGLVPGLRRGSITGSERWFIVEMVPGSRPLDELEVALMRIAANQGENIHEHLERDESGLLRTAGLILPLDGSELVIVIDQFEEVFSLVEDERERGHFLTLLSTAVSDPNSRVRIAITLRADFYDRPLHYPLFGDLVRRHLETVLPLSAEELERSIARPAERIGMKFEPGLIATIVEEVLYQPGALPLLQYALTELFDQRQGDLLTHQTYQKIGRAVGALAGRAEEIYRELNVEGKDVARQIFLGLVTLRDEVDSSDVRRRAFLADLLTTGEDEELVQDIIEMFAAYRLISLDHDPSTRRPIVELAHEAILSKWDRLRAWIDESREDLRQQRQLSAFSQEWLEAGKDPEYLLRGTRLDQVSDWAAKTNLKLTPTERSYLQESSDADQARQEAEEARRYRELEIAHKLAESERTRADEQAKAAGLLRHRAILLAVALLVTLGLASFAFVSFRHSETQRRLAVSRELAAAAVGQLTSDPELSILLSLEAANQTFPTDRTILPEVEDALHRSLQASRVLLRLPQGGGGVSFSPDSQTIATSEYGGVIIWDAKTGREVLNLPGNAEIVTGLEFSPDGSRIYAIDWDGWVMVWDASSGERLLTSNHSGNNHYSLRISSDGKRLATGGESWAFISDANTGTRLNDIYVNKSIVGGIAFNREGDQLITAGTDGWVNVWTGSGEQLMQFPTSKSISEIDISSNGELLAAAGAGQSVNLWDLDTGKLSRSLYGHYGSILDVKFSPDGRLLATGSEDGTARVWDVFTGQQLLILAGHQQRITRLAFSSDGNRLATSSYDGTTRVWDITPEGGREWLTKVGDSFISWSSSGENLATSTNHQTIIWDVSSGKNVTTLVGGEKVSLSPDGRFLATIDQNGMTILWEASSGKEIIEITGHDKLVNTFDFSPDSSRLATGSPDGRVNVWEAANGKKVTSLIGHPGLLSLDFSPQGDRLVTAGSDCVARIWDLETSRHLLTLTGDFWESLRVVSYSPDGSLIAAAGGDGKAVLWDALTGKILQSFQGNVSAVAFSPDGKRLATAGYDATVKLWNIATNQEVLTLTGHRAALTSVSFSPDGRRLASSSEDGTIRVYAMAIEDLMELARGRLTRGFTQAECQRYLHLDACPNRVVVHKSATDR